jgi:hypothetical protein
VATVAIAAGLTGCSADFDMKQLMVNMKNSTPKESEITLEGEVAYNPDDYIELSGDVAIEDMTEQNKTLMQLKKVSNKPVKSRIPKAQKETENTLLENDIYELSGMVAYEDR